MKRVSLLLSFFLIANLAFSQTKYTRGETFLNNKQYREAITAFKALIVESPRDEQAWYYIAKAYYALGQLDSAELAAKKAIELEDDFLDAYTILSDIQLANNRALSAYETIKQGMKYLKKREYPLFSLQLGKIYLQLDSSTAALIAFTKYAEDVPNDYRGYEGKGDAYAKQNLNPMALMQYEKALELDSSLVDVLYKIARIYIKERQYTDAGKRYAQILKLQPDNVKARLELAELYYKAKLWSLCAATLREYIEKAPNPSQNVLDMYLEALYNGRYFKDAFTIAEKVLKSRPSHPMALRALGRGYIDQKEYQKSVDTYLKLQKIDTLKLEDYRYLGYSYRQLKKDSLAALALVEALKYDSTDSDLLGDIGALYMNLRNWELAAYYLERRIHVDTTAVAGYINLASCLMQLEQYDKAIVYLKKAAELNPNYPPTYVNIGFCYSGKKDFQESRKWFEKAIQVIDTAQTRYRLQLADSYKMIGLSYLVQKADPDDPKKKWEDGAQYLEKALLYKEDDVSSHVWLGQAYQNLQKTDLAIKHYKRALKLDPKNKEAQKGLKMLEGLEE
ncbi:MAG: tetratricopeptide repeat protein [Bacteroidetes bacterium]|nr:tetratricopeptide repeat protein [Bacteroidota bacterium]